MKVFPSNKYHFKLIDDDSVTLERLTRRIEKSERLISKRTEKSFIGLINGNEFRLISSETGKGALCVLNGKIKNQEGTAVVEINTPFKVIFSIFMLLPIIGLLFQIVNKTENFSFIFIIVCILQIVLIRYFFIELFFRIFSKQSVNKLSDVLDTEWIDRI